MADYAFSPSARPTSDENDAMTDIQARIEALQIQLELSDAKVRPPALLQFIYLVPPHIGTKHMTQSQLDHQAFPYSMPKSDGLTAWIILTGLKCIYLYHRLIRLVHNPAFAALTPLGQFLTFVLIALEVSIVLSGNVYPMIYACILRSRKERWPTRTQVWGTEREKERERERGEANSPVKGVGSFLRTVLLDYSLAGWVLFVWEKAKAQRMNRFRGRGYVLGDSGV